MSQSTPTIRPFVPDDLPALQAIRRAGFMPIFRSFREIVGEDIAAVAFAHADAEQAGLLDDICAEGSGHQVLVVILGGKIVGFVSFTADAATGIGEIGLNAIDPEHAGKGLGTWMYQHVLAQMKDRGIVVATVGVGGDASHAPARRAYEKAGFGPAAIPSVHLYKRL